MNIKIIAVGSVKEEYYRNIISVCMRKIRLKCSIELIEVKDEGIPRNAGKTILNNIKNVEADRIMSAISTSDYVAALCIEGKQTCKEGLARLIGRAGEMEYRSLVFVIGGSLGLADIVVDRADYRLSFSAMTFPHQLMRVMLLEEIAGIL